MGASTLSNYDPCYATDKEAVLRRREVSFPYYILRLAMSGSGPDAVPDPLTIVLTVVVAVGAGIGAALVIVVDALERFQVRGILLKKIWLRGKIIFYPLASAAVFGAAVLLGSAYESGVFAYLLIGPAIGLVFWSIRDGYGPRIPRSYLWFYLLGAPITFFMAFNYSVGRSGGQSPFIGHSTSLALAIVFADFAVCGVVGIIGHSARRSPRTAATVK